MVDVALERAVLAGLCQYGSELYYTISDILEDDVFSVDSNKVLFKCLQKSFNSGIDKIDWISILSSANELGYGPQLDNENEKKYIASLFQLHLNKDNIDGYASKLYKLYIARLSLKKNREAAQLLEQINGSEPLSKITGLLERPSLDILQIISGRQDGEIVKLGDTAREYIQYLIDNPRDLMGIATGFDIYDYSIGGGLRRKTISVIGARTKTGKTWVGEKMGLNIAKSGIPVLFLDTEMAKEDHHVRLISMLSGFKVNDIETGKCARNKADKDKLEEALKTYESIPFFYQSIAGQPIEDTLTLVKKWLITNVGYTNGVINDCVVVYDYLKLMSADPIANMAEFQALGFLMTNLHNFVVKNDIPILAFVQLNRDGIDRESTDVVSQSDRINWLCSNMSIYKHKTKEEIAEDGGIEYGNMKMVPIIARHGAGLSDGDYINIFADLSRGKIAEGSTKYQLAQAVNKQEVYISDDDIPFDS